MTNNEPILMQSEQEDEPRLVTVVYSRYMYFPKDQDPYDYLSEECILSDLEGSGFTVEDINIA